MGCLYLNREVRGRAESQLAVRLAARLGLAYGTLAEAKPSIIVCDISGYGKDGPYRDKKAYDLLIQSEAGFLSVTGTDADPVKAGCSIADIAAGMYAYSGILAALIEREDLRNRVIRLAGYGRLTTTTRALDEAGQRISHYLLMQSIINTSFGIGIAMSAVTGSLVSSR